jgi:hypothetical protein
LVRLDCSRWRSGAGHASEIAGGAGLIAENFFALYAIAGVSTLLLGAGIYGSGDLTFWITKNRDKR